MAKTWDQFYNFVLPQLPAVPNLSLVQHHVKQAAIEFLDRSKVWRVDLDPISVTPRFHTIDLEAPQDASAVIEIAELWFQGEKLIAKTSEQLTEIYGAWQEQVGTPKFYLGLNISQIRLVPMPSSAAPSGITGRAALKPTQDATGIEDDLFDEYVRVIAAGAIAALCALPRKPWSDPALVAFYGGQFEEACSNELVRAERGFTRAPLRARVVNSIED